MSQRSIRASWQRGRRCALSFDGDVGSGTATTRRSLRTRLFILPTLVLLSTKRRADNETFQAHARCGGSDD
jgi:hypothetical protein